PAIGTRLLTLVASETLTCTTAPGKTSPTVRKVPGFLGFSSNVLKVKVIGSADARFARQTRRASAAKRVTTLTDGLMFSSRLDWRRIALDEGAHKVQFPVLAEAGLL